MKSEGSQYHVIIDKKEQSENSSTELLLDVAIRKLEYLLDLSVHIQSKVEVLCGESRPQSSDDTTKHRNNAMENLIGILDDVIILSQESVRDLNRLL